jgi:cytochrome c
MRVLPIAFAAIAVLSITACKKSELTDAQKAALVAQLPAPYNTADLANGKSKFAMCKSCHTIAPDGVNMTGPALYGVFGRKAGSKEQFLYSAAVRNAGFTWDAEHLDKWLSAPRDFLPGTKMSFVGIPDAKDRIDLIAYLDVETHEPAPAN